MELEGAKRCFSYLKKCGLAINIFISDRHRGIAKWIMLSFLKGTHWLACILMKNVKRRSKQNKNGEVYMKVTYPKYKFGEELVREVACAPTYGKLYFSSDLMKMPNGHEK